MYDIRQFKPVMYAVLLLGISGFSVAAGTAGLWVVCTFFVLLHAWLSKRGRFKPMPRWLTNIVLVGALVFVIGDAVVSPNSAVLFIGEFLVLLQIIKIWELRTNRDYAQMLVLGLILTVAAAISTSSLWFGLILLAYLFMSVYCCLLFQLKVEADTARLGKGEPAVKSNSATLRQDERYLSRSMRRFSTFASVVGIAFGAGVFLVFPRGNSGGLLGPLQFNAGQALVGFSDRVNFQNIARVQQSNDAVAWVGLKHNGKDVAGTETLLLRGTTLDSYRGNTWKQKAQRYQWTRTDIDDEDYRERGTYVGINFNPILAQPQIVRSLNESRRPGGPSPRPSPATNRSFFPASRAVGILPAAVRGMLARELGGEPATLPSPPASAPASQPSDLWEQHITLKPTGSKVLFSMAGPQTIKVFGREVRMHFLRSEQVIEAADVPRLPLEYEVVATNQVGGQFLSPPAVARQRQKIAEIDPQIVAFARRPDVSGRDGRGASLATRRDPLRAAEGNPDVAAPDPLDAQIASNIEKYLKSNFAYTLDLTDTRRIEGRDPLVAFLYDFKRGHCEYFAGAMTLLCQSLGLQARMVVGFHCEGDSFVGGYYQVQQSSAHAWVEVLTTEGWRTYDPTSAIGATPKKLSWFQIARNVLNYADFAYARSVVAYDGESQNNVMRRVEQRTLNMVYKLTGWFDALRRGMDPRYATPGENGLSYHFWTVILRSFIALMALCLIGAMSWYFWDRRRLRRRAARIGIDSLPLDEQLRLAKQLGFYDELLRLLARHRMNRPKELTPREFGRSLLFLPAQAYETVLRMTELFYRVRYGRAELTSARRRHLASALGRLGEQLEMEGEGV